MQTSEAQALETSIRSILQWKFNELKGVKKPAAERPQQQPIDPDVLKWHVRNAINQCLRTR